MWTAHHTPTMRSSSLSQSIEPEVFVFTLSVSLHQLVCLTHFSGRFHLSLNLCCMETLISSVSHIDSSCFQPLSYRFAAMSWTIASFHKVYRTIFNIGFYLINLILMFNLVKLYFKKMYIFYVFNFLLVLFYVLECTFNTKKWLVLPLKDPVLILHVYQASMKVFLWFYCLVFLFDKIEDTCFEKIPHELGLLVLKSKKKQSAFVYIQTVIHRLVCK